VNVETIMGGLIALCLAVVALLSFVVKWFCSHMDRQTTLIQESTKMVNKNTAVTSDLSSAIKELNTFFRALNGKLIPKK